MKKNELKIESNPTLIIEIACFSGSSGKFVLTAM